MTTNLDEQDIVINNEYDFSELKTENMHYDTTILKNDLTVWGHILRYVNFSTDTGNFTLTSKDIKNSRNMWSGEFDSQFEPRLLCKQDSNESRPSIFKQLNINILSISNGIYILTTDEIYKELPYEIDASICYIKKHTGSLVLQIGDSESLLLDNLRYSGVFERPELLNEQIKYGPIFSGRHRCHCQTYIGDTLINIKGTQFETDGCYESENKIIIIEAKIKYTKKNFNIRQLYYPFRTIYDHNKGQKEIECLYINYDKNKIIHVFKFKWENHLKFNNLRAVGYYKYKFI